MQLEAMKAASEMKGQTWVHPERSERHCHWVGSDGFGCGLTDPFSRAARCPAQHCRKDGGFLTVLVFAEDNQPYSSRWPAAPADNLQEALGTGRGRHVPIVSE